MKVVFQIPGGGQETWGVYAVPRVGDWVMLESQPISLKVTRVTWFFNTYGEAYASVEFE